MKFINENGFLVLDELDVPAGGGVTVEYYDGARETWQSCCMMPNLTEEELFSPSNSQDWNFATSFLGFVQEYMIRDNRVYWNYAVNFNGVIPAVPQRLRIRRSGPGGAACRTDEAEVNLVPGGSLVLCNWREWTNVCPERYTRLNNWRTVDPAEVEPGWYEASDEFGFPRLVGFGATDIGMVSHGPKLNGRYDLYLGLREQLLECELHLPGGIVQPLLIHERTMPTTRFTKDFYVGTYDFTPTDVIGIARRPPALVNKLRRFGDIEYVRLTPAARPAEPNPVSRPLETVFYSEPYSMCYYHCLQNESQAEQQAETYAKLGVDKIICQSGRVGCRMMHYSEVSGMVSKTTSGDDRQKSNGVVEALRHMDVMKELGAACRRRGIRFLANLGANSPYPGSSLESAHVAEHPEYFHAFHKLFLDYAKPEVIEFAAEQFRELAEYDWDGLSIGYTRYPYGIDAAGMVNLQRRIIEKIGRSRRRQLELNISIIADLPDHYAALEKLLAEDWVDSVCVGRMMCNDPEISLIPYRRLLARYPGKKLYGTIDGWNANHSGLNQAPLPRPADCVRLAERYDREQADGIYFYQSEQILVNPFLWRFVKSLKEKS